MEENTILEQPNLEAENSSETQEGSTLGKFKDVQTLLDAYNSLQAEFTRKSQKLSELQKESNKNAVFSYNDSLEEILKEEKDNDKYKKEITEIIANDSLISSLPNKNQVAFKIVKEVERNIENKINSQDFIDKCVREDGELYKAIVSNYLSKLNNIPTSPNNITSFGGNVYFSPNQSKPKTLKEAGEIFSKMLK